MNIFIKFVFLVAVVLGLISAWFLQGLNSVGQLQKEQLLYISSGSSIKSISKALLEKGIINNNIIFNIKTRWDNKKNPLKAGEYLFNSHISIKNVILKLQKGKTYYHQITIPEGLTSREIVNLLNKNKNLTGKVNDYPIEGSLLPETYSFSKGDKRKSIIKHMQEAMVLEINSLWGGRAKNLPVKTKNDTIILASIIEKETAIAKERPRIAGVFINRLNRKIPLQTDPTVIYSITLGKKDFTRKLTYKDLKTPSPYNTYMVQGLPPTAIANPGIDSIKAVLNPEINKYIYFVANGKGGHVFAKTLKEHNRNVRKWRKIQKNLK